MTEGLFILTTIFVAYVVYVIASEQKAEAKKSVEVRPEPAVAPAVVKQEAVVTQATVSASVKPEPAKPAPVSKPAAKAAPKPTAPKAEKAEPTTKKAEPAAKKVAAKPVKSAPAPAPVAATSAKNGLKDPVTGEVAASYSNYRFTKRWIKDALVTEGLLPKVYKNNELDPATEAQIKTAIEKLEAITKYQA